jgi:Glycosyl hydrolases family 16
MYHRSWFGAFDPTRTKYIEKAQPRSRETARTLDEKCCCCQLGDVRSLLPIVTTTVHLPSHSIINMKSYVSSRILLLVGCILPIPLAQATYTLLWSDEFNTTSLQSHWNVRTGNNDGWGNGELQVYTADVQNVGVIDQDHLEITVLEHTDSSNPPIRTFSSGRMDTLQKFHFRYGTAVARIQFPDVDAGLWPAFWTLGCLNVPFPGMGEIDIMEVGQGAAIAEGKANQRIISGAHWERNGAYTTYAGSRDFDTPLNGSYNEYRLDWTPENLTTYVNEQQVWTMDITSANCEDCEEFHQYQYLILNVAVGGGFTSGSGSSGCGSSSSGNCGCGSSSSGSAGGCGPLRTAGDISAPLPATMKVDWVRVYDNGSGCSVIIVPDGGNVVPSAPAAVITPPVAPTQPYPVPFAPNQPVAPDAGPPVAVVAPISPPVAPGAPVCPPVAPAAPVTPPVTPVAVVAPIPPPYSPVAPYAPGVAPYSPAVSPVSPPSLPIAPTSGGGVVTPDAPCGCVQAPSPGVVTPSAVAPVGDVPVGGDVIGGKGNGKGGKGSGKGGKGDSLGADSSSGKGSSKGSKKGSSGDTSVSKDVVNSAADSRLGRSFTSGLTVAACVAATLLL